MNILFTDYCDQRCDYCFAQGKLDPRKRTQSHISLENLGIAIDFLKRSKRSNVGVIGGEPTLHPEFRFCLQMLIDSKLKVLLFTHGLMDPKNMEFLHDTPEELISMLFNVNEVSSYSRSKIDILENNLAALRHRVTLGFTIARSDFSLQYHLDLIARYELQPVVRLGIAAPIWGESNQHVSLAEHPYVAEQITAWSYKCEKAGVQLSFDCGFLLCSFTNEQLGQLCRMGSFLTAHCSGPIDVGPELDVWRCFATSMIWNKKLNDFSTIDEINDYFTRKFNKFRSIGSLDECFTCPKLPSGLCAGGCLGHTLRSFQFENKKALPFLQ